MIAHGIVNLPALIGKVHSALLALAEGHASPVEEPAPAITAAQIRKSVQHDRLISFIDGKSYKTLKRHLTKHGLDPHTYRERYGLPADYPTTSANYSAQRSALAKSLGLGQPGRSGNGADAIDEVEEEAAPAARGRRKAATATAKGRSSRKTAEAE